MLVLNSGNFNTICKRPSVTEKQRMRPFSRSATQTISLSGTSVNEWGIFIELVVPENEQKKIIRLYGLQSLVNGLTSFPLRNLDTCFGVLNNSGITIAIGDEKFTTWQHGNWSRFAKLSVTWPRDQFPAKFQQDLSNKRRESSWKRKR